MFDWIVSTIDSWGYVGVFLLMLLEHVFPPIPSELIMPLAGYLSATGGMSLTLTLLVGTAGSVTGTALWYFAARAIGETRLKHFARRYGRVLTLSPSDIDTAHGWFIRYGSYAVFFGRMIPAIRTLISVPAGFARMPFGSFLVLTTLGSAIWTALLTLAGYVLESQYHRVEGYIDPLSKLVLVVLVVVYLYRIAIWKPH